MDLEPEVVTDEAELLLEMGEATSIAIDEASKKDIFYLFTGLCRAYPGPVCPYLVSFSGGGGHLALCAWDGSHTSRHCPQQMASSGGPGL
jgi:hypothetical protein